MKKFKKTVKGEASNQTEMQIKNRERSRGKKKKKDIGDEGHGKAQRI